MTSSEIRIYIEGPRAHEVAASGADFIEQQFGTQWIKHESRSNGRQASLRVDSP
jgi:hypothetical protein